MGAPTEPVYRRVLADLRAQIHDGTLPPGARVPSRNAIMSRYGVGETAAKHALQVLAAEGLIEARAGSGSYVRVIPAERLLEHDRPHFPGSPFGLVQAVQPTEAGDHDEVGGEAMRLTWEHHSERVSAPAAVAARLHLPPGDDRVMRTRYLLAADSSPVQVATSYEPLGITAGTPVVLPEQGRFAGRGVIARMAAIGVQVDQVVEEISVRPSLAAEASALNIAPGAPVLAVERAHLAADLVAEVCDIVVPAGQCRLRYRLPVSRLD
ncbi:MAG TPA: GntR family transcriptional regulator [Streptosporangiaceae bacterium]|nr:GntR family transcriptional regulator [Streptosporangiaceae bacterium]